MFPLVFIQMLLPPRLQHPSKVSCVGFLALDLCLFSIEPCGIFCSTIAFYVMLVFMDDVLKNDLAPPGHFLVFVWVRESHVGYL